MSDRYILDADGNAVLCEDLLTWARWYGDIENGRCLARTERDDVAVSTVFLGLDHSFGGASPVLWETMVFGGAYDGEQERYTSKDAAHRGHAAMCAKVWPS